MVRDVNARPFLLVLAALLALRTPFAGTADWPQFRGPDRSGVSNETGLPLEWSATKNLVWKTPLPGPGTSSPIVFGNHVYVTCYSGYGLQRISEGPAIEMKPPGNLADLRRHLVCIDRASGKILWTRAEADPDGTDASYKSMLALHGYASHTPAADASGVYAYFGGAGAVGYGHDGQKKWGPVRLGSKAKVQDYGSAASPVLYKDLLIVNACIETAELFGQGETVALDTRTGNVVWREKVGHEWSSPLVVKVGGQAELVVATHHPGPWLGLDPATGQRLWQCKAKMDCSTPVAHDGVIYAFAGNSRAAIRAGGRGDVTETHKVWQTLGGPRISSPVYHGGYLYWSNDGHLAQCVDARTGETVYREPLGKGGECYASPLVADGRIYYVCRDRGTYVVAAKPEFQLLAHNRIEDDPNVFNGSPAVSGDRLFLRSDKYLYCIGTK